MIRELDDKVLSVRVVDEELKELKRLLNMRYGYKKIFLNSVSYVVRKAIKRKIRDLKINSQKFEINNGTNNNIKM